MRRWLPYRNTFLQELLRHEGMDSPSSGGTAPVCHHRRTIIKTPPPCAACPPTSSPSPSSAESLPKEPGLSDRVDASSIDESNHTNTAGLDDTGSAGRFASTAAGDGAAHDHHVPLTSTSTTPPLHSCAHADYRCRDCLFAGPSCKHCILAAHRHLPFHVVEVSLLTLSMLLSAEVSALALERTLLEAILAHPSGLANTTRP